MWIACQAKAVDSHEVPRLIVFEKYKKKKKSKYRLLQWLVVLRVKATCI